MVTVPLVDTDKNPLAGSGKVGQTAKKIKNTY